MEIKTGFRDVDDRIKEFESGDLVCIASSPNKDLTTFVYNIVKNVTKNDIPILLFSGDTKEYTESKLIKVASCLSNNIIETTKDLMLLDENITICDQDVDTIDEIELISKSKSKQGVKLIVIDYLQRLKIKGQDDSKKSLEEISNRLKKLAKEINKPIIVLSELPQEMEKRTDHRPTRADLQEYGITKYADTILFVYRDDYYDEDSELKNVVEVIIAKSKNGNIGTEDLLILYDTKYCNLERCEEI